MSNQSNAWGENPDQAEEVSSGEPVSQEYASAEEEESYEAAPQHEEENQEDSVDPEEEEIEGDEDERARYRHEIKRLRGEKYRILNEAKVLQEENEFLKNSNLNSHQTSLMHYDNFLNVMMNQAVENKKKAIENGDTDEIVKADVEMSRITARSEQLNDYKTQQVMQAQRVQQQMEQQYQQASQPEVPQVPFEVQEWLINNKWYVPNTSEYHPQKAKMVMDYAQRLDVQMAREGRQNEYYTPDYFDRIDAFARNVDKSMNGRNISMKEPQRPLAPVQAGRTVRSAPKEPELSKTEKDYIKWMKIKEEDYKKHKKIQMEKERMVEQQRRSIGYGGY